MYELTNEPSLKWYHKIMIPIVVIVGLLIIFVCIQFQRIIGKVKKKRDLDDLQNNDETCNENNGII
jgi:hypothetical protein